MNETLQSVLAPHGPQAGQIATLAWILFSLAAVVLAVVIAATLLAIRGSPRLRAILAREKSIVVLGLIFPAVTLTLLLGYGVWLMRPNASPDGDALRIEVTGEQWWWRVKHDGRCAIRERKRDHHPGRAPGGVHAESRRRDPQFLGAEPRRQGGHDTRPRHTAAAHRGTRRRLSRAVRGILRRSACPDGVRGHRIAADRIRDVAQARGVTRCRAGERSRATRAIAFRGSRLRHLPRDPRHGGERHDRSGPHASSAAAVRSASTR